jgi:2'-5' RNA ligase
MVFEQDDYEVLVAEVEDNKFLTKTNESLKDLDFRNDYDDYKPHITIAYLKR